MSSQQPGNLLTVATSVLGSGLVSAFVAGTRWGAVRAELAALRQAVEKAATGEEVAMLRERFAKIEGMFQLTLKRRRRMLP